MTTSNHDEPAEVLERYLQAQPKMEKFYDMAVNYFKCKCLDKTNLERCPPVALCLRDPDHVFTVKPGFLSPRKRRQQDGILQNETQEGHHKAKQGGTPSKNVSDTICRLGDTKCRPQRIEAAEQRKTPFLIGEET